MRSDPAVEHSSSLDARGERVSPEGGEGLLPMSRRRFVRIVGGGLVISSFGATLAACGGSATSSTELGTLNYLGWEDEDGPKISQPWKQAHGLTVNASYVG